MKKIKLVAPILGATVVAGVTANLLACACTKKISRDLELADKNVASLIVSKNDESGIECTVKATESTKEVASVQITIGGQSLVIDTDFTFVKSSGKITISQTTLTKYKGNVIITTVIESIVKSIDLNIKAQTLDVGETFKLIPTTEPVGYPVSWVSDKPEIASIDKDGNVTAKSYGQATIIATAGDKTATCTATVSKYSINLDIENLNLYFNQESTINATVQPQGTSITWKSSKPAVATVDNGKVKALTDGDTIVSASITTPLGKTYSANCNVHVQECYITLDKKTFNICTNDTEAITATVTPTGKTISWNSSDDDIASVSNGIVTGGTKSGTATITASVGNVQATCSATNTEYSISFDDASITLFTGDTKQLTPTVKPSTAQISWKSSDDTIATVDNNGLVAVVTDANNEVTITATITTPKGNKISSTKKIDIIASKTFAETEWSIIEKAANDFEASAQDETAMKTLCRYFTDCDYISTGSTVEEHLANIIGKTKTIQINNKEHTIRVIGINHDRLSTSTVEEPKYALFTFEMVTLLSASDGKKMTTKWDATNNFDYTNSILRKNLTGNGEGTFGWSSPTSETKTALELLPTELKSIIKLVNKNVAKSNDSGSSYILSEYDDKLFPLTYTEMAQSGSEEAKVEGSAYLYWTKHNSNNDRIKKDASNSTGYYFLVSPTLTSTNDAWYVNPSGVIKSGSANDVDSPVGIPFGFCI